MNKTATSRQALLEAAREIARRDGLGHISIRRTAAMCGVSVGHCIQLLSRQGGPCAGCD